MWYYTYMESRNSNQRTEMNSNNYPHHEASYFNDDVDADVYGNGASSFIVQVYNYESDERSQRKFCQKNAKARAIAYAEELVKC